MSLKIKLPTTHKEYDWYVELVCFGRAVKTYKTTAPAIKNPLPGSIFRDFDAPHTDAVEQSIDFWLALLNALSFGMHSAYALDFSESQHS
jgi:hypothetical protein